MEPRGVAVLVLLQAVSSRDRVVSESGVWRRADGGGEGKHDKGVAVLMLLSSRGRISGVRGV